MLFAEFSDAVWLGIIGVVMLVLKEYFDRERAKETKAQAERDAKLITDKQDANHKLLNSELIEMKRIITEAAHAQGVLAGKAAQKAETDATTLAAAGAVKSTPTGVAPTSSQLTTTDADGKKSVSVTVVGQEVPVPVVDVGNQPKKG